MSVLDFAGHTAKCGLSVDPAAGLLSLCLYCRLYGGERGIDSHHTNSYQIELSANYPHSGRGIDQNSLWAVLTLRAPPLRCGIKNAPLVAFFRTGISS